MELIDEKIKDAFSNKIYVKLDEDENFRGLVYIKSKREIEKRLKKYPKGFKIGIPTIDECIDITVTTYNKLKSKYKIPEYYLTEKWNTLY